jgi:iron-sulfur cluster repair protein YtfE (RIC family)
MNTITANVEDYKRHLVLQLNDITTQIPYEIRTHPDIQTIYKSIAFTVSLINSGASENEMYCIGVDDLSMDIENITPQPTQQWQWDSNNTSRNVHQQVLSYKQRIAKQLNELIHDISPYEISVHLDIQIIHESLSSIINLIKKNESPLVLNLVEEDDVGIPMDIETNKSGRGGGGGQKHQLQNSWKQQALPSSNINTISHGVYNYNIQVPNQFHYDESTRVACISISLLTIYHLYNRLETGSNVDLSKRDWETLLHHASALHKKWKVRHASKTFPTIEEVLALDACKKFLELFGSNTKEYCGIAVEQLSSSGNNRIVNPEGDLKKLFNDMKNEAVKQNRIVCALIILPHNTCISIICQRMDGIRHFNGVNGGEYFMIMFDSHGGSQPNNKQYCELMKFTNCYEKLVSHLIIKYGIKPFSQKKSQFSSSSYTYQPSEEEIISQYGYSAKLFLK